MVAEVAAFLEGILDDFIFHREVGAVYIELQRVIFKIAEGNHAFGDRVRVIFDVGVFLALELEDVVEEPCLARAGLACIEEKNNLIVLTVRQLAVVEVVCEGFPRAVFGGSDVRDFARVDAGSFEFEIYFAVAFRCIHLHCECRAIFREIKGLQTFLAVNQLPLRACGNDFSAVFAGVCGVFFGVFDD